MQHPKVPIKFISQIIILSLNNEKEHKEKNESVTLI